MRRCEETRARRRYPAVASGLLCATAFFAPAGPAAQAEGSLPLTWELRTFEYVSDPAGRGHASRFYNEHFLPRMTRSFETYGGVWLTREAPGTVQNDVVYEVWSEAAAHQAERATRRALTDYLLEETSLSNVLARVTGSYRSAVTELQTGGRRAGLVRWDAGISHGLPKIDLLTTVGARGHSTLRFSLGGDGRFGVEFRPGPLSHTRLRAVWLLDEGEYRIGANFDF